MTEEVVIEVRDRGSLRVRGTVRLVDGEGVDIPQPDSGRGFISLCRCGMSREKPYCDSTHRDCGWDAPVRAAEVAEIVRRRDGGEEAAGPS